MTEHTPGPWNVVGRPCHLSECVNANGPINICHLHRNGQAEIDGQVEANAKLIAAAPDLLEACKHSLGVVGLAKGIVMNSLSEELRAAIKATE